MTLIVLDTNVVSELMRHRPDPRVLTALARVEDQLALCAPVIYEISFGIARLRNPEPKARLLAAWTGIRGSFRGKDTLKDKRSTFPRCPGIFDASSRAENIR